MRMRKPEPKSMRVAMERVRKVWLMPLSFHGFMETAGFFRALGEASRALVASFKLPLTFRPFII